MLLSILKFLFICAEVIVLFNLLILVHELGHFLAARWRGLVVEKFAIWFGKPIWKKTIDGVEYRLGSIPAGGFVAIPQLAPMEAMEGRTETHRSQLPPVKPIDKIIVAFAGPLFSFGLAVLIAVIVWIIGRPVAEGEMTTVAGYVKPDGPAAKAGMQAGDRIVTVNGVEVKRFGGVGSAGESIIWNIARSEAPIIPIRVERDGKILQLDVEPVSPERKTWGRRPLRQILIDGASTPKVAKVIKDSPAAEAGLKRGDLLLELNGKKLLSPYALLEAVEASSGNPIALTVRRDGQSIPVTVKPRKLAGTDEFKIGITWDLEGITSIIHPNPVEQVSASVKTMWATITAILSPRSDIKVQHLSGPVGIMNVFYLLFESQDGWRRALWFAVVLNVNLAIMNLLPIPVLDGGHITLALLEAIMGRDINTRIIELVTNGCALLIIGFMLYVTFFDVLDLKPGFPGAGQSPPEMKFEPSPGPAPAAQ